MEKSSIQILTDFAKKNGYHCWSDALPNESILPHRGKLITTKHFVLKYPTESNSYYFCASDRGANMTYSGLYGDYSKKKVPELIASPKFWVDRFIMKNRKKSGISEIDRKVSIRCTSTSLVKAVINPRAGNEFIRLSKKVSPINLVIENNDLSYNPELEYESIIGLHTNRWITDEKELILFLDQGSKLLNLTRKN